MDAMILAAGLGTRLRPLTDRIPKALVPVAGVPILERVARRLIAAGADRLVVNLHHHADAVRAFIDSRNGFGVEVLYSHEPEEPLETGGGLALAAPLLRRDHAFFLHNVDVLSDLPLGALYGSHTRSRAIATLAVMNRSTSRRLLFDRLGLLGRTDDARGLRLEVRDAVGPVRELAFAGVHVLDPAILDRLTERGAFSILDPYLRLAAAGEPIRPFEVDGCAWADIGSPERLAAAERLAREMEPG